MLKNNEYCKIRIVTDCNCDKLEDVIEESKISKKDLNLIYQDLKDVSSVIINEKRMTAVSKNRLLSILILNKDIVWSDIVK